MISHDYVMNNFNFNENCNEQFGELPTLETLSRQVQPEKRGAITFHLVYMINSISVNIKYQLNKPIT